MNCEQLLLKAAVGGDVYKDEFQTVTSFYGSDFDLRELEAHLSTFTHNIPRVENVTLSNVLVYLRSMSSHQQQLLSQVIKLAKLILVMSATNATSERSFSALRCIKTYPRTAMTEARLNHLMLYVHKDKTSAVCMVEIANAFVRESKYRLGIFGKFVSSDLANVQATVKEKSTQTKV